MQISFKDTADFFFLSKTINHPMEPRHVRESLLEIQILTCGDFCDLVLLVENSAVALSQSGALGHAGSILPACTHLHPCALWKRVCLGDHVSFPDVMWQIP